MTAEPPERLLIRHRTHHPLNRGSITLDAPTGAAWICVEGAGHKWQSITLTDDEARQVRDWLTAWLDSR